MKLLISFLMCIYSFIAMAGGLCDWPAATHLNHAEVTTGLSYASYNTVLAHLEAVYTPIFEDRGCQFQIVPSWTDATVNAQAWREGNICYVQMFGGLAREPGMTEGAYAQVGAHEIGHHLGGKPYFLRGDRMSVEGQADYYATATGMYNLGIDSEAPSQVLADELAKLDNEPKTWLPGPVLPAVSRTYEDHPAAQCRRVTYEAGRVHAQRPSCWFKK